jgi:hypothetical protein
MNIALIAGPLLRFFARSATKDSPQPSSHLLWTRTIVGFQY